MTRGNGTDATVTVRRAALALRAAQRAYLADRGNDELGKAVGEAAASLDKALATPCPLEDAAKALYMAGRWSCDREPPAGESALWENLRDACGITPGTASAAGVGA